MPGLSACSYTERQVRTLVCVARAHADVACIARFHNIMERLHLHPISQFVTVHIPRMKRTVSSIGVL